MATILNCPANSEDHFGPRVDIRCRIFDFTLLFEESFFVILPTSLFLLLFLVRLKALYRESVKVTGYRLAVYKLVSKSAQLVCQI